MQKWAHRLKHNQILKKKYNGSQFLQVQLLTTGVLLHRYLNPYAIKPMRFCNNLGLWANHLAVVFFFLKEFLSLLLWALISVSDWCCSPPCYLSSSSHEECLWLLWICSLAVLLHIAFIQILIITRYPCTTTTTTNPGIFLDKHFPILKYFFNISL